MGNAVAQEMIVRDGVRSIPIDRGRIEAYREAILARAVSRHPGYVCFANVHSLYTAWKSPEFLAALESAFLVAPDGMPIAWALSAIGVRQERYEGMSAFPDLLIRAAERNVPVAFFGSDQSTLEALVARLGQELPSLRIVEAISPGFGGMSVLDLDSHVDRLAGCGAGMVFVALGCPKQEAWMHRHADRIPAVLLGVGNAFGTWLGYEKRAPPWLRKLSMEWIVRLAQDPARLWKRYFFSNSWFLFRVVPWVLFRLATSPRSWNR